MDAEDSEFGPTKCVHIGFEQFQPYTNPPYGELDPQLHFSGISLIILEIVLKHLNYCYTWERAPENRAGKLLANGRWNGLIGALIAKVWLALFLIALFLIPLLNIVFYLNWKIETFRGIENHSDFLSRLDEGTKWAFFTLISQALWIIPKQDSKRIILGVWLIATFIFGTVYKSTLKAMLISPNVPFPFQSLDELLQRGDITYAIPEFSVVHTLFEKAPKNTEAGRAWALFDKLGEFEYREEELIQGIMNGYFSYVIYKSETLYHMGEMYRRFGRCSYISKRGLLSGLQLVFFFPKKSPLKKKFDKALTGLKEFGILDRLRTEGLKDSEFCLNRDINAEVLQTERPLQLPHFYGVFMLYGIGIGLSCIAFILEMVFYNRWKLDIWMYGK